MATRRIGNININFTPSEAQTQLYNALGRGTQSTTDGGNLFTKRASSIGNAVGTTLSVLPSIGKDVAENIDTMNLLNDNKNRMNDVAKKYGYNTYQDVWDAREAAQAAGDTATLDRIDNVINPELQAQANINAQLAKEKADRYTDYRENNLLSKNINQDRGKFLGSAINTLSTGFDLLSMGAGIPNGALINAGQGAIEGIADELEQNGLQNFDWGRAGQNAAVGAASGAVTGALNTKLSNALANRGGKILAGGNNLTQAVNNFNSKGVGRALSTIGSGAARGALSGAAGGATGAGLSSALQGADLGTGIVNALQGARQGATQGALVGGTMAGAGLAANAALNKVAPNTLQAIRENQAKNASYGDTMRDQFKGAYTSGESPLANRIADLRADSDNGFGLRYNQFVNNAEGAINYLLNRKGGEVEGAVKSPAVEAITGNGDVDLVYGKGGDDGYGLAHIVERHGEGVARRIPSILETGKVVDDPNYTNANRITLVSDDNTGAVRLGWDGNKKQWVVTAYEGLPYSPASSAANEVANSTVLRGSSVQEPNDATVKRIIPQSEQNVNMEGAGENDLTRVFEPESRNTIQSRNKLQSVGEQLQNAAKTQKYGALYDALDAKTATRAVQTGAPEALSKLGINPENYLEAAKTSNYVNKVVSDLAEKSGVKVRVPGLTKRLSADNFDVLMSDTATKKYNSYIKQIIPDGATPDEYSAGYLLQKSRELGNKAANLRGNTDDVYSLRQALTDAKYTLRDLATDALEGAEITGDLTNDNLAKGLAQIGANQKVQDYYTEAVDGKAPSVADYIRRSALFEQARDMGSQVEAEKYTRSASKAATNPVTKVWNASGLDQPVNAILRNTVAPIAGGITNLAGKAIAGAGDIIAGRGATASPAAETATTYNPATQVYNAIGRTEGLTNAEQARTAEYLADAVNQNNGTLESLVSPTTATNATSVYNSMYGGMNAQPSTTGSYFPTTGDYWTDILGKAMSSAMDANDAAAFGSLYNMYQEALTNLKKNSSSETKLTDKQRQANAAALALDEFEKTEPNAAYDVSDIPIIGSIANLGGNDYASKAEALALQVGYMLSGATVNKEEAKNIGMAYVPQPRDNAAVRQSKINQIRGIISEYQKTYAE